MFPKQNDLCTLLICLVIISNCFPLSLSKPRQKCIFKKCLTHIGDLKMEAGDMISCRHYFLLPYHNLLATGPNSMIHIVANKRQSRGYIVEDTRDKYVSRNQESWCFNEGPGSLGRIGAVNTSRESLMMFKNKPVYYNLLKCNCQHWVEYWANGEPKSPSVWKISIDKRCPLLTIKSNHILSS
ncbi:uncharacterized protein LOC107360276 [Tetranychus urticae]|uniref:LRAT domain-containing protein n=1 Tax=Tetranychus urticae TaxID=32264 RepID=T1K4T4_TETUR|nr:uncharacterized protein LOC107360276 [Tetranychus urticae]